MTLRCSQPVSREESPTSQDPRMLTVTREKTKSATLHIHRGSEPQMYMLLVPRESQVSTGQSTRISDPHKRERERGPSRGSCVTSRDRKEEEKKAHGPFIVSRERGGTKDGAQGRGVGHFRAIEPRSSRVPRRWGLGCGFFLFLLLLGDR